MKPGRVKPSFSRGGEQGGNQGVDIQVQVRAENGGQKDHDEKGDHLVDPLANEVRDHRAVFQHMELGAHVIDQAHQQPDDDSHEHARGAEAIAVHQHSAVAEGGLAGDQVDNGGRDAAGEAVDGVVQLFHQLVAQQEHQHQRRQLEGELEHAAEVRQGGNPGAEDVVEEDQRTGEDDGQDLHHGPGQSGHPGIPGKAVHRRRKGVFQPVHDLFHNAFSPFPLTQPWTGTVQADNWRPGRHKSSGESPPL